MSTRLAEIHDLCFGFLFCAHSHTAALGFDRRNLTFHQCLLKQGPLEQRRLFLLSQLEQLSRFGWLRRWLTCISLMKFRINLRVTNNEFHQLTSIVTIGHHQPFYEPLTGFIAFDVSPSSGLASWLILLKQ